MKTLFQSTLILLVISLGCTVQTTKENEPEDIKEAEKFVVGFYKTIEAGDTALIESSFGNDISPMNGVKHIRQLGGILGTLESVKIETVSTKVTKTGERKSVLYVVVSKVDYTKGSSTETITATTKNDTVVVSGYEIDIDIK